MKRFLIGIALAAIVAPGCAAAGRTPAVAPRPGSDVARIPERVSLAGKTLTVEALVWRDFQPITPPGGSPLMATVRIKAADGTQVPASLRAEALWVVADGKTWTPPAIEEQPRAQTAPDYGVMARNGPKWEPGTAVDVVVRLRDARGNRVLLRAPRSKVARTD